jgi:hypothetical protein
MSESTQKAIKELLAQVSSDATSGNLIYRQGQSLYLNGQCTQLIESEHLHEFSVNDKYGNFLVKINTVEAPLATCTCNAGAICRHRAAAYMQLYELMSLNEDKPAQPGLKYTRRGMIKRVMTERIEKARQADYTLHFADNIYGEHVLINERGTSYHLTFRNFKQKIGYCSCPDYNTNKLGTCKHLIYAFNRTTINPDLKPEELPRYPFIEVFCDPLHNYRISWFHPEEVRGEVAEVLYRYFGNKRFIEDDEASKLIGFFNVVDRYKEIMVRPEVYARVQKLVEEEELARLAQEKVLDFSRIKVPLLPYQRQGVEFATFKKGVVLADDMELDKPLQAIATAVMKKDVFGFGRTLIICPATLKQQWKNDVVRYCSEPAHIVAGTTAEREAMYGAAGFIIVSYETVIRDQQLIAKNPADFIILDEAQRIRNYASVTSSVIKSLPRKHALVLSATPLSSELIDLYSIIMFVDAELLSPLWEFSYQHCYFDEDNKNVVAGYYNLEQLEQKLSKVMLRREKQDVIRQLPGSSQITTPVKMSENQVGRYLKYARQVLEILNQKIFTLFDEQKVADLLKLMLQLGNSTFLVDDTSNSSPKLTELKHILSYKLHIRKSGHRVIIVTRWIKMANIIARALRLGRFEFAELNAEMPETERAKVATRFANDDECRILLTTTKAIGQQELLAADTLINFELPQKDAPWLRKLPANLTIISLVAEGTLEEKMAQGLLPWRTDAAIAPDEVPPLTLRETYRHTLSQIIAELKPEPAEDALLKASSGQILMNFAADEFESPSAEHVAYQPPSQKAKDENLLDQSQVEPVMRSAAEFFSQLFKITTGQQIQISDDMMHFDAKSGEMTLKFKIAGKE